MPSLLMQTPIRSFRPAPVGRCFREDPEWIYARHYAEARVRRAARAPSLAPGTVIQDDHHHDEDPERWDGMS
jgi:hypothetical protein